MTGNKNFIESGLNPDDDAPELTEEWFARGDLYLGGKLVRRGRPLGSGTKELVSLRLDKEALAAFKATGPGWQVRINQAIMRSAKRLAAK
jgi:BrnA antitoxin of type II toxin-antitoxin system